MKVALVHDYLTRFGGAERVFFSLLEIFPKADIYTLLYNEKKMGKYLNGRKVNTSFVQKLPFSRKYSRLFAPLMPSAIESLDMREYDLIISSSTAFAKGLIIRPKTTHICYCHTPTRFVWDYAHQYDSRFSPLRKLLVHYLRIWDKSAANRVDYYIANSKTTAERIKKYYGRESEVIYPPVFCHSRGVKRAGFFAPLCSAQNDRRKYFLIVSQLTPHKRIDLAIKACNKLEIPLMIIGEGRDKRRLKKMACSNVKFLGHQPDDVVRQFMQGCFAFVFAGEDDFGIAPVEAMGYGKPVLAYRAGGATETVIEGVTGEFFDDPVPESLADGIRRLKINYENYNPEIISQQSQEFSQEIFNRNIKKFIIKTLENDKRALLHRTKSAKNYVDKQH
ncbi:MAG: glycosyltransferase [bacterium]